MDPLAASPQYLTMSVVIPPVLVHGRIVRIVAPVPTILEVEEWTGEWWEPSTVTLTTVSRAAPVDPETLLALGLPLEDAVGATTDARSEIQQLLRAPVQQPRMEDDAFHSMAAERRRKPDYTGSMRFRDGRASARAAGPDAETRTPWTGPLRRSSDGPIASEERSS